MKWLNKIKDTAFIDKYNKGFAFLPIVIVISYFFELQASNTLFWYNYRAIADIIDTILFMITTIHIIFKHKYYLKTAKICYIGIVGISIYNLHFSTIINEFNYDSYLAGYYLIFFTIVTICLIININK